MNTVALIKQAIFEHMATAIKEEQDPSFVLYQAVHDTLMDLALCTKGVTKLPEDNNQWDYWHDTICNFTSWFVRPDHIDLALKMYEPDHIVKEETENE